MQIKLRIPKYVEDMNIDLVDNEVVFLHLLLYICSNNKEVSWDTVLYFHKYDLQQILAYHPEAESTIFQHLRRYLRVGNISADTISIQGFPEVQMNRLGNVEHSKKQYIIEDPKVIATFYYLAGRVTDSEIVSEHTETIPYDKEREGAKAQMSGCAMNYLFWNSMENKRNMVNKDWHDGSRI